MRYRGYHNPVDPIWIIIAINAVIFVVAFVFDVISPTRANPVIFFLGLQGYSFSIHPWTIVTNLFTHVDLLHILFNLLTFYFFGSFLISLIGNARSLIVYFGGGILGNIFYLMLASPFAIAIGASGAIFSLGGALAVLRPNQKVYVFPIPVPISLWMAVVGGFLLLTFFPNVAWQAHLGGLVFGAVAGYFFRRSARYIF